MKKRNRFVSVIAGILAAVMLLSLILSLIPTSVDAASSSEIKKQIAALKEQKKELESQMKDVQSQTKENESEIENLVNQKDGIDQEIFLLYEQIENIDQQLAAYALLIADKQDELDSAQGYLDELTEKNRERIRAMEEDGSITCPAAGGGPVRAVLHPGPGHGGAGQGVLLVRAVQGKQFL